MHSECAEVVVIGGGVVGMTTALALADAGRSVQLYEAGEMGQEASWAGGGIMSPLYTWRCPKAVHELFFQSLSALVCLVERLKANTPIDPELNVCGMWVRALADTERDDAVKWAERHDWPVAVGPYPDIPCVIPNINMAVPAMAEVMGQDLWFPQVANVRNPRLLKALSFLLSAHPRVRIFTHSPVQAVEPHGGQIRIMVNGRTVLARDVVCAAGAWSSRVLSNVVSGVPRISPVMGQMLLLKHEASAELPMVLHDGLYTVPRKNGLILVGSTVQYCGFRKHWDEATYQLLLDFACALFGNEMRDAVQAQWSGLRPDAGRDVPIISAHPTVPGLWINTGHFRNGLVLATGSAQYLEQLMRQGWQAAVAPHAYGVDTSRGVFSQAELC